MATSSKSAAKPKPAAAPAKKAEKTAKTAKPAAAKPAAPKTTAPAKKATPAKKPASAKKSATNAVTPEQKRYYIEVAAYYIAERRGFNGGSELDDWVQAEREIDRLLSEGILNP